MSEMLTAVFAPLVFITVAMTAFGIGLVTSRQTLSDAARRRQFAVVIVANVVVVPLVGFIIARALPLSAGSETGVILCVMCAGGPLGLKASQISRSDVAWSLSLTVTLLLLNVVTLPVWSKIFLGQTVSLRPGDLLGVLVTAIVLPVVAGSIIGRGRAALSQRWADRAYLTSNVFLVLAVIAGLGANTGQLIASLSSWSLLTAAAIVGISGLIGLAIPDHRARKRASTLGTMNRATSVALLVVARVFPSDTEVFTAIVTYGLVQTVVAVGLGVYLGRAELVGLGAAPEPELTH